MIILGDAETFKDSKTAYTETWMSGKTKVRILRLTSRPLYGMCDIPNVPKVKNTNGIFPLGEKLAK